MKRLWDKMGDWFYDHKRLALVLLILVTMVGGCVYVGAVGSHMPQPRAVHMQPVLVDVRLEYEAVSECVTTGDDDGTGQRWPVPTTVTVTDNDMFWVDEHPVPGSLPPGTYQCDTSVPDLFAPGVAQGGVFVSQGSFEAWTVHATVRRGGDVSDAALPYFVLTLQDREGVVASFHGQLGSPDVGPDGPDVVYSLVLDALPHDVYVGSGEHRRWELSFTPPPASSDRSGMWGAAGWDCRHGCDWTTG
jgi:hypothetical protein